MVYFSLLYSLICQGRSIFFQILIFLPFSCCGAHCFCSFLSGLGFITSITFIFLVGVFMSSWLGTSVLSLSEWLIKRMPFVRHIYNASKQISTAISPGNTFFLPWWFCQSTLYFVTHDVYLQIKTLKPSKKWSL